MTIAIEPTQKRTAPGPKGKPLVGNMAEFTRGDDPFDAWLRLHHEYGDIVRMKILGQVLHLIRDPDAIQHILQMNNRNYIKGRRMDVVRPLIGNGLVTSEGEFWRRQWRLAQPAFHRRQIEAMAGTMVDTTESMLAGWDARAASGATFDVSNEMMRVTMDIVTRTLFTTALSAEEFNLVAETFNPLLEETNRRSQKFISLDDKFPTPSNRRYQAGIRRLDEIIYRIIEARRTSGEQRGDLLGMLMAAQDEETGQGMTDQQLRDEVMTIFLAGHETTAVTLTWALGLLSQHPDIRRKLQQEVDAVLEDRRPGAADFPRLLYTQRVIEETMRLFPPAIAVARSPLEDDQVGGYDLPGGSNIIVNIYGIHRHPSYWENPEGFDPDRFLPEASKGRHRYAYIPFSAGPRMCIGNNFAMMEATLILAMITRRYEANLFPGTKVIPQISLTLRPRGGMPMVLQSRN